MIAGRARRVVRGVAVWVAGYALTLVLVVADLVDRGDGAFGAAALAYLDAHVLPSGGASADPAVLVAVPVLVLGIAGYRIGRSLRTGITGRLRTFVQSLRGTERARVPQAATATAFLAGGYALAATVVALLVGAPPAGALVGSLLYGLAVGVPAALIGAFR